MREARDSTRPRRPRLEHAAASSRPLDCAGDDAVSLGVQVEHVSVPVGSPLDAAGHVNDGHRIERSSVDAGNDLDLRLGRLAAQLAEPGAVLGDEVEREAVATGRDGRAHDDPELGALSGGDRSRQRRADPVPDDGVATLVQPVVRGCDIGAPRRRAGVLDFGSSDRERARTRKVERPGKPTRDERPGHRASVGAVPAPLLVRACRREIVERTPVWFMRQAGRSLPEYRALRERHGFFEVAETPELCAEVTLQPVRRHDVDAAVLFADIVTPVLGMGVTVELVEGVGPVIDPPLRSLEDVRRLRVPDPAEAFAHVLEAIRLVRAELQPEKALVGFCGGPFTVACYLVQGRGSRDFQTAKELMYREPVVWHALMERLTETFAGYVAAQTEAGADVIQLFDSWAGILAPRDYEEFAAPYSRRVLDAVSVPTIHFGTGTAGLLTHMRDAGGDVIGLDWRVELDRAWAGVGLDRGVQGNLDPVALLGPWGLVEAAAEDVLRRAGGRRGHVFNLGHGVLPATDPDVITRLTAFVRERTAADS